MRIGAVLLVGATALRWRIETLFGTQLLLALSLLGQVGVIGGLVAETEAAAWAWALGALLEAALVALYPDALHRFLATLAALLLAVGAAVAAEAQASVHMLVGGAALGVLGFWDREGRLDLRAVAGLGPVGYGLAVGLLLVLVGSVGPDVWRDMVWWPSTLVLTAVLLALVVRVLDELEVPLREPWAVALMVGLVGLGAVSWFAPGIVGALFVSALAVRHQRRVLLGVALVALGGFLIAFYYNLEQTLLAKSFLLMASGAVLLGLRAVLPLHTRRRHA